MAPTVRRTQFAAFCSFAANCGKMFQFAAFHYNYVLYITFLENCGKMSQFAANFFKKHRFIFVIKSTTFSNIYSKVNIKNMKSSVFSGGYWVALNRFDVCSNHQLVKYVNNYLMMWLNIVIGIFWSNLIFWWYFRTLNIIWRFIVSLRKW